MAASSARPVVGALAFLTLHGLPSSPQGILDAWVTERRPTTLLRDALEMRSDYAFVEEIVNQLGDALDEEGLDRSDARAAVAEVLSAPSLALSAVSNDYTGVAQAVIIGRDVAQAVIIGRDEAAGRPVEVLVSLRATVRNRHHPSGGTAVSPAVTEFNVSCRILDMEGSAELGDLMAHYIGLVRGIGSNRSKRTFPHTVLVLGDLLDLATEDAPKHWKDDIALLAEAFDARVVFDKGTNIPRGIPRKLMRLFTLDPYSGKLPEGEDGTVPDSVSIDARAQTYSQVFQQMAAELRDVKVEQDAGPRAPRDLKPGENRYHRKVGDSRGGYDNFDDGSDTPICSHDKGYKRYFNSDQATKGFARRYKNFDPSWMYHCSSGKCNVYAVFAPEGAGPSASASD